ncbi:MAG: hypothetical protein R3F29_04600 [Planctomycetota bacterium]
MRNLLRATPALLLAISPGLLAQDGVPAVPVKTAPVQSIFGSSYVPTIVFYNQPGHPTNAVPGLGLPFKTGGGSTSAFERPWFSGNEAHFGINVLADSGATTDDDVLLIDSQVALREGDPLPWAPGENVGTIDADFAINSNGDLLVGHNSSATTNDDYIAARYSGVWVSLAQEGGSMDTTCPTLFGGPGGTWDDNMDAPVLLDSGLAMWRAELVDGLSTGTANDEVFVLGNGLVLQEGIDIPLNQDAGGTLAWENFDLNDVYSNGDGTVMLIQGDLAGTVNDDIVALGGVFVVVQEGVVLAGSSFAEPVDVEGIVKAWVDNAGSWYVRGNNDVTETDWVYRNGAVVAQSDGTDEIVAGSGEHWDDATFGDCFFAFDGNSSGAYVIGGVTDAAADVNGVLVLDNGQGVRSVLVRESDPIDVDGNGLFDDDRFFNTFGNDDVLMLENGAVIFTATVKDAAGTSVEQGVFQYNPINASCTVYNGSGVNPVATSCLTLPQLGQAWNLVIAPGATTVATVALAGFAQLPPVPLFGGEALILPPVVDISGGVTLPNNLQFVGAELFVQGVRLNFDGVSFTFELTNAIAAVVGG